MSQARLIHITTVPQTLGFLRGQVGYMSARGFDVYAISSSGPRLRSFGEIEQIKVHSVQISRTISPARDLLSLVHLVLLLLHLRPTIVSYSTPKAALIGAIASWLTRVSVRIFLVRGSITEGAAGARRSLFLYIERLTAILSHQVICVAPSLLDFVHREGIVPPHKGIVMASGMSNGVDTQRFDPTRPTLSADVAVLRVQLGIPEGTPVVGFVGRLCADKGLDDLAVAWQTIRVHDSKPILMIVGRWEQEDPVSDEAREMLQSDSRVVFAGYGQDMPRYYKLMTVLAFPTRGTEGFPNVPMEASAMGVPVVATETVGCVDAVVDGATGFLVPPRAPHALAKAILAYLDDPELCHHHGQAGRERVLRDFRPEGIWRATYCEYIRLLRLKGLSIPSAHEVRP